MILKSLKICTAMLLTSMATTTMAADLTNGMDVLSPAYAQSTELLSQVDQILATAENLSTIAFELQQYPGLDEEQLLEILQLIRSDLSLILTPERRRMEYQTVVPDAAFVITDK